MRRTVGLKTELILTTALLVGAALLFGGFLLLRLSERQLVEQKVEQVRTTVDLIGRAITSESEGRADGAETLQHLLTGLDRELQGWVLYDRKMRPLGSGPSIAAETGRPVLLAQQARLQSGPQLQVVYPSGWLPFLSPDEGSIAAAVALRDRNRQFAGVVWLRLSLADVQSGISSTRHLVMLFVFLYGLVLTAFGVVVLNRNVVRPLNRLNAATADITGGDLGVRVEIDGPREIADLGESFNRMTAALQRGQEELLRSERMASVGHLSAGMAHEIGNPLAAIIGYLEMLKTDIVDDGQRDLVRRSLDEASRIDRLVRDLLDYAAPTGGDAVPVALCALLEEAVQSLQSQSAFEDYRIVLDCRDDLPAVCVNPHKLIQVLVNLIVNARDASAPGSRIAVTASAVGQEVVIAISDQGEGIDVETRPQIFDPFFSTKPQGVGRGLGLTICHRIVTEAGGRIEVDSGQQQGSTFSVHLPATDRKQP